jgi:hypothetical protein
MNRNDKHLIRCDQPFPLGAPRHQSSMRYASLPEIHPDRLHGRYLIGVYNFYS